MEETNEDQAPRRDPRVERAIRQRADAFGGDPFWALRLPGESSADTIDRIAKQVEAQHARVFASVAKARAA